MDRPDLPDLPAPIDEGNFLAAMLEREERYLRSGRCPTFDVPRHQKRVETLRRCLAYPLGPPLPPDVRPENFGPGATVVEEHWVSVQKPEHVAFWKSLRRVPWWRRLWWTVSEPFMDWPVLSWPWRWWTRRRLPKAPMVDSEGTYKYKVVAVNTVGKSAPAAVAVEAGPAVHYPPRPGEPAIPRDEAIAVLGPGLVQALEESAASANPEVLYYEVYRGNPPRRVAKWGPKGPGPVRG